jgi:hypothetical protein
MKTYLGKIKKIVKNDEIVYQAQLKQKTIFSFLLSWWILPIMVYPNNTSIDVKIWTNDITEIEKEFIKFSYLHKVKVIIIK